MKKLLKIGILLVSLAIPFSCDTDFLNTKPLDKVQAETTWEEGPLAQAFVFGIYSHLGYGGFEEQMLASYTDEALFTHTGRNINVFNEGTESPSNLAWTSDTYRWGRMYEAVRAANLAIENLPDATFTDVDKNMLLGEAYFLRAYYYHQLLRFYGGFPIVDKLYGLDDDYSIPRSTFEDCVNFIVGDLDQAATLLEGKTMARGRASKLAALGLKSRVLLYAASDLHDAVTASANSSTIANYDRKELIAYTSGDRNTRWAVARDAAKAVLDLTTGYKFDLAAPVTGEEGTANYLALSMGGGSKVADAAANVELLFERTHTPLYTEENEWPLGGIHHEINNGPNGYHNWSGNTPIQQLVDDYERMDGSNAVEFDWSNPTHNSDPYAARDPRFYATILYDGAPWKPRPSDMAPIDPVNQIQTGYYNNGNSEELTPGIDTRDAKTESWNGSHTGYYVRKFIDPDPAVVGNQSGSQVVPWPFIRYTEIALNYAEACIELGQDDEAKTWLNKIRFRAGMPAITETGGALRERYRNERRVELAYEEHRYHDVRRWMIAPTTVNRDPQTIRVVGTLKPGETPYNPYRHDKNKYSYTYTVQTSTNENRTWVDKMYFRPIARDEVNKNDALVQNPGYE
ncbi:RagB/SusD family nutrient uptake outer membrane protein [Chryseosolibacter indicus]|uniref:RagB/SusD family nutrient uptake outer membrane protein n=1 Tax=Chryseosolibacter indicus TaxID=2782351 RepID=A0ABS5VYW8_9BACT|nr:RagB/SusD family nutrient uptake outer membrane protein [Chryseosolibacter indicus]MBT1705211.1 RagB/SusD family nutrient uptake outer membrane protein [Chryseosolibacter indicus]